MATMRAICQRTARRLGVSASGETIPDDEAEDLLEALKAFLLQSVAQASFGGLTRVLVTDATYTAGEDEFIAFDGLTSATITLPTTVTDADTGETRAPHNYAIVTIAGVTPQVFIYDEAYGDWLEIAALTLTDYCPMSTMSADHLSAALMGYVADEYGRQLSPLSLGFAQRGRDFILAKLRKAKAVSVDLVLQRPSRTLGFIR